MNRLEHLSKTGEKLAKILSHVINKENIDFLR